MVSSVTSETNYFICMKTGWLQGEFFLKKDEKRKKCGILPHFSLTVRKILHLAKSFILKGDILVWLDDEEPTSK